MADGLTVPFALAAGLAGTVSTTALVVVAGIAEIAAGSIAMGLGGYLAAKTEHAHYHTTWANNRREIDEHPDVQVAAIMGLLRQWKMPEPWVEQAVREITLDADAWTDFLVEHHLHLEHPPHNKARRSSVTIAVSYIIGGFIPLFPYFLTQDKTKALFASIALTSTALIVFGYLRAVFTGTPRVKTAFETALVGGIAAAVAFLAARRVA